MVFQFHKGTIRTVDPHILIDVASRFQFHKGTIRTRVLCRQFNQFVVFQFHKGTIRTKEEAADTERWEISIP